MEQCTGHLEHISDNRYHCKACGRIIMLQQGQELPKSHTRRFDLEKGLKPFNTALPFKRG